MSRRTRPSCPAGAWLALAVAMFGLTGCTSAAPGHGTSSVPSSQQLTAITPIPGPSEGRAASSPATASSPSSVAPRSATATAPRSATATKATPPGLATCSSAQLGVRALRGGAVAGQEIALITFTNRGAVTCAMFGYPGVSLRRHDALLGRPAERSIVVAKAFSLAPGAAAEAMITDFSSCQAPVSETVRVYAPDQKAFTDQPLELRGCRLLVDPVRPGS